MAYTLLRNAADWEQFQAQAARESGMAGLPTSWGMGPPDYPCLAATKFLPAHTAQGGMPMPPKFLSVFLTMMDARSLLEAAGFTILAPGQQAAAGPGPLAPGEKGNWGDQPAKNSATEQQWKDWIVATLLTHAKIMEEVKLFKREQYEEWLLEGLDCVRAQRQENIEKLRQLSETQKGVLDRFIKPE